MQEFLHRLGVADKLGQPGGPQFIHVAGTNGKGSTVAFLQSLLVEQGYRTGAMYSPYVYDVRERVQVGRELIPKEDFARLTERLFEAGVSLEDTEFGGPTEFEMKTAMGFMYWAEQDVEWVALEVGLGGRLDATNVVDPAVSVITSISLDHTHILGDTIAEIATEKAGIIKLGRPVVVGNVPSEAKSVIEERSRETGSRLWRLGEEFNHYGWNVETPNGYYEDMEPGLTGDIQAHNMALAVAALDMVGAIRDSELLEEGTKNAYLPGRFERIEYKGRTFILDGAHNLDAAQQLIKTLRGWYPFRKLRLLTAQTHGHDVKAFYDVLRPVVRNAYVAKLDFHRTRQPEEVIELAGFKSATAHQSTKEALEKCLQDSRKRDTILVTGSLYIVGEIGNLIRQ